MIFIFFSLLPHASSWELLEGLWLSSSRDCLLLVAENASSSDNIRFSRNSSHLCFTSLLCILDIIHNIYHSSLSWVKLSSNSSTAENIFFRNDFAALGRSLISPILSWFVEIISNACFISSSKARLYVPDRFRMTDVYTIVFYILWQSGGMPCLFPEKSASNYTVPPYHSLEVTCVTLWNSQYIPPNHWELGLCEQMSSNCLQIFCHWRPLAYENDPHNQDDI